MFFLVREQERTKEKAELGELHSPWGKPSPGRGISETRKNQAVGADLFRWSTLMQWLGDHEVGDEVYRKPSKLKESETPETTSSVTCGASFPY